MKVVLLVASNRGIKCLKKVINMLNVDDSLTVFTFRETDWEPKFSEEIMQISNRVDADCFITNKVHDDKYSNIWLQKPDLILVIGWRYLIPNSVYDSAKIGCFVFHDSYLPQYRGFGPSVWAVRNGEQYTGATLFKIAEEMDAGPILEQRKILIHENDYIADVVNNVTETYLEILESTFHKLRSGNFSLSEQDHERATYTCKSLPEDFRVDWKQSAFTIRNLVRAYAPPYSGCYFYLEGNKVVILEADVITEHKYVGLVPGRIIKIENGIGVYVGTGENLILIRNVMLKDQVVVNSSEIINRISLTLE